MTRTRPPGFSLAEAVRAPGFTPRAGDVPELVGFAAATDEALAGAAGAALARLDDAAPIAVALAGAFAAGDERARMAVVALEGRLVGDPEVLARRLRDDSPRVRKAAAQALGRLGPDAAAAEPALIARLVDVARDLDARSLPEARAIVEALGKLGGAASADVLGGLDDGGDPELARILQRARLRVGRGRGGATPSSIPIDRKVRATVVLGTRNGLEPILIGELADRRLGVGRPAPGGVAVAVDGPLGRLLEARTWQGLWAPLGRVPAARDRFARAIAASDAATLLGALGPPPWRYRLAWADGRHRRAATLALVVALAEAEPRLANDPAGAPWELRLAPAGADAVDVALHARGLDDPRWAFRSGDVPAASHPPLAAALARLAGVRDDDVVWDPFCGSGLELAERHLLGPYAHLIGTDTDPRALDVAAKNLAAAGVPRERVELVRADATAFDAKGVTLVLTNPPMGRRVHRGDVGPLLERTLQRAAAALAPGGRIVWVSPVAERTLAAARAAKLRPTLRHRVDMGGFTCELQRLER